MKLPPYPKYKPSGVEWLGEVPEHWEVKGLRYVCHFAYGDSLASEDRVDGDVLVFGSNGPVGTHTGANTRQPVIVIGRKGSHGKVNFCGSAVFAIDTTYFIDERFTSSDVRWLFYALGSLGLDAVSSDSAVPGLGREDAYTHSVTVPATEEQCAIAHFLDRETAKIDTLVAKKRTLIERLKEKRTALISRTVTRGLPPAAARAAGLDPHPKLKPSGIDWLGDVPEYWEVDRLKWTTTGTVNGIWGEEPNGVDDLMCVRVADFDRERFLVVDEPPTVRAVDEAQRRGRVLCKGDLLIEKSGGGEKQLVGCVVFFNHTFAAVCSNFVARMPIVSGHSARFWSYAHAALYAGRLNYPSIKQTTGIQNLDSEAYLSIRVGLPPHDEQRAIADFLDRETAKLDGMVAKVETAIERLQEYRSALITAAVTGKIDVRRAVA